MKDDTRTDGRRKPRKHQHDPLCALPEVCCVGCLLVDLRSEATYAQGAKRKEAVARLVEIRDLVQGHLDDVYGVERPS